MSVLAIRLPISRKVLLPRDDPCDFRMPLFIPRFPAASPTHYRPTCRLLIAIHQYQNCCNHKPRCLRQLGLLGSGAVRVA